MYPELGAHADRRPWWFVNAPLVVTLLIIVALVVLARTDDDTTVSDTTTTSVPTTAPSTTTPPPPAADAPALWPFPGTGNAFTTPRAAAESFATEFLRFQHPILGEFEAGDTRSGEVAVRPAPDGPRTTILVRQLDDDDRWSVLGATTDAIDVTAPAAYTEIASPVRLAGRALAFEGNVRVEIRADGDLGPIGEGFVTGGGDVLRPFEGSIPFETPGEPYGAVVLFTESAENGQVWQATAFRVAFRSTDADAASCDGYRPPRPRPGVGEMEVKAYFSCDAADGTLRAVYRIVPSSPRVLQSSLAALLAGPSPDEAAASLGSWFSSATAGMLRSVTITDGHAIVDLADLRQVIPNASASAGSARLLDQLDATVFQFRSVESVEYRLDGSCDDFNAWLQLAGCDPRTRGAAVD